MVQGLSSNWPGNLPGCPGLESTHAAAWAQSHAWPASGRVQSRILFHCQLPKSVVTPSFVFSSHVRFAQPGTEASHGLCVFSSAHTAASSEVITGNMRKVDCVGPRQIRVQSVAATPDPDPVRCGCARRGMRRARKAKPKQMPAVICPTWSASHQPNIHPQPLLPRGSCSGSGPTQHFNSGIVSGTLCQHRGGDFDAARKTKNARAPFLILSLRLSFLPGLAVTPSFHSEVWDSKERFSCL